MPFISALLFFASLALSQQAPRPITVRSVRAEKIPNQLLEKAILEFLGTGAPNEAVTYFYNRVDLNRDGKPEVLVYLAAQSVCGSGGCTALVFKMQENEYKLISEIALASTPIVVSSQSSNGWSDLILSVAGGGIQPGRYAVLRFDGARYPENPTVAPATILRRRVRGVAYLVGAGQPGSGIVISPGHTAH